MSDDSTSVPVPMDEKETSKDDDEVGDGDITAPSMAEDHLSSAPSSPRDVIDVTDDMMPSTNDVMPSAPPLSPTLPPPPMPPPAPQVSEIYISPTATYTIVPPSTQFRKLIVPPATVPWLIAVMTPDMQRQQYEYQNLLMQRTQTQSFSKTTAEQDAAHYKQLKQQLQLLMMRHQYKQFAQYRQLSHNSGSAMGNAAAVSALNMTSEAITSAAATAVAAANTAHAAAAAAISAAVQMNKAPPPPPTPTSTPTSTPPVPPPTPSTPALHQPTAVLSTTVPSTSAAIAAAISAQNKRKRPPPRKPIKSYKPIANSIYHGFTNANKSWGVPDMTKLYLGRRMAPTLPFRTVRIPYHQTCFRRCDHTITETSQYLSIAFGATEYNTRPVHTTQMTVYNDLYVKNIIWGSDISMSLEQCLNFLNDIATGHIYVNEPADPSCRNSWQTTDELQPYAANRGDGWITLVDPTNIPIKTMRFGRINDPVTLTAVLYVYDGIKQALPIGRKVYIYELH